LGPTGAAGLVAVYTAQSSTDQTFTTVQSDITGVTTTQTFNGTRILIRADFAAESEIAGNTLIDVFFIVDGVTQSKNIVCTFTSVAGGPPGQPTSGSIVIANTPGTSHTIKLQAATNAGSAEINASSQSTEYAVMTVEDLP